MTAPADCSLEISALIGRCRRRVAADEIADDKAQFRKHMLGAHAPIVEDLEEIGRKPRPIRGIPHKREGWSQELKSREVRLPAPIGAGH